MRKTKTTQLVIAKNELGGERGLLQFQLRAEYKKSAFNKDLAQ